MAKVSLCEDNFRTNEVLSEQIAVIQEFAHQLEAKNVRQLEAKIPELETAVNRLKELMTFLPK